MLLVDRPARRWQDDLGPRFATRLRDGHRDALVLDGDELRERLNCDLGFDRAGRAESARRTAEIARIG
ncbi:adenylyl-sulfate kinase [Burkholderia glumae]|nr:adenylyl-sulfate kinase [Burkholderia glumae]